MAFEELTKQRVEKFLRQKKSVLQSDVQFLGLEKMQIKFSQVKTVLKALEKEGKITIKKHTVGKRKFFIITWQP